MIMGYGAGVAPLPNRTPVVALAQSLFLNGENGGFYRPADWSTLFQDYLGKDPVTALGQPVGLELDTSRGVWGDDLAVNGDFSNGLTDWYHTLATQGPPVGFYPDPSGARSPAGEVGNLVQAHPTPASHVRVRWTQTINSGSRARIRIRNFIDTADTHFTYVHGTGTFQFVVPCVAGGVSVRFIIEAADDVTISNVTVTEIDGNHQSIVTATARPVLARQPVGGRRNIITHSESAIDGVAALPAIGTVTINSDSATAPNGQVTADTVDFVTTGALRSGQASASDTGAPYTISLFVKLGTHPGTSIEFDASGARRFARFNLQTLQATDITSVNVIGSNARIDDVGSGWYRLSATCETDSGGLAGEFRLESMSETGSIHVWGWQVEVGRELTAYQRVGEHWDVTEAGVRDCYYLRGDGLDDTLTGPNLPLSDDYTMVAGLQGDQSSSSSDILMFGLWQSPGSNNDYLTIMSRRDHFQSAIAALRAFSNGGGYVGALDAGGTFPHGRPVVASLQKANAELSLECNGSSDSASFNPDNYSASCTLRTRSSGGSATGHFSSLIINRELTPAELQAVRTAIAYDAGATLEPIDE